MKRIYEIDEESPYDPEELIDETGLYFRKRLKCWQIWYVDAKSKVEVGFSDISLGQEMAEELFDEFIYVAQHQIGSVFDIAPKSEIH